ncbi:MAG: hypothetical protein AB7G21_08585 [Dehalococcoidia bacterium]
MWEFTGIRETRAGDGTTVREPVEPTVGIGPGPLDDEDFEAAVARVESQYDDSQRGVIKASGVYVHRKGRVKPLPASSDSTNPADAEATEEAPR